MKLDRLSSHLYQDEGQAVDDCLATLPWDQDRSDKILAQTKELVAGIRTHKRKPGELDSFMQQYGLNTDEGLALMTLAEALLRIPDPLTANLLIRDKVTAADWVNKKGGTRDWLVKAAGLGLTVSKRTFESVLGKLGEPMIRQATLQAMKILGHQFVLGRSIEEAVNRGKNDRKKGYRFSYDMLGEGARTFDDAQAYYDSYAEALRHLSLNNAAINSASGDNRLRRAGISVKLSALYPRYEYAHADDCVPVLVEKMITLCQQAKKEKLNLTMDAEEVDRLELSLEIFEQLCHEPGLQDWNGLGLAVQAYQKRCLPLIDHLADIAQNADRKIQVRLVKGAYWDTEIKHAQIEGLPDFPVFSRKGNTDVCFLASAQKLLKRRDIFYPMLATHNAHTVMACLDMAENDGYEGESGSFEFQRLHGMGDALYDILRAGHDVPVSIYAPVGTHKDLLPYLVRRLLENGANSSFVNKIADQSFDVDDIVEDPVMAVKQQNNRRHHNIRMPVDLYADRRNAKGLDLADDPTVRRLVNHMKTHVYGKNLDFGKMLDRQITSANGAEPSINPANLNDAIGTVPNVSRDQINNVFAKAKTAWPGWNARDVDERALILERIADLYEQNMETLIGLCVREAGRTMHDALLEVREAVDFCRYYAVQAREKFEPQALPGPTGESNVLEIEGRGIFVCISPWNFPLAIFTGQIAAALVTGNAVVAKPAEQTPLVAAYAVQLMTRAGVPKDVLHLVPGDGQTGAQIIGHADVGGVAFTGSSETARIINRALADKDGPIVPFIAETGGQNAMIVDSSALSEQVVDDLVHSAFYSAGQRCSAARVAFIQDDVADSMIRMLKGAVETLTIGDPLDISNDIGPVIDEQALEKLENHRQTLERIGKKIAVAPLSPDIRKTGHFFAPSVYEIESLSQLKEEVFGPILHIIRYSNREFDDLLDKINDSGYGLTFGVHSRIESRYHYMLDRIRAGNCYVNRSITGAVVGVQPFGGRGLSGTGPKAGGPHYLNAFVNEKTVTINTAAIGGNASLVGLDE